jgi:hypothetical protein
MNCPKCNSVVSEGTQFCSNCGENLGQPTVTQEQSNVPIPEVPQPQSVPTVPVPEGGGIQPTYADSIATESKFHKSWMAITSLVLGVLGLITWIFPYFGAIFALIAIILGILGIKTNKKTLAIVGIVLASISLLFSLVITGNSIYQRFTNNTLSTQPADVVSSDDTNVKITTPAGYKRVGQKDFGYLNVPEDWVPFTEAGSTPGTMMQYSDKAGFSVLTVTKYPKNSDLSAFTTTIVKYLTSSGPSVIQTDTKAGGLSAKKLWQNYSSEGKVLETYVFEESGKFATISVEYKTTDETVAETIVNSYNLNK